jgi:hypothetical protein
MKRTSPLRHNGVRSSDPFTNLTTEQLTYIGAVAMLYNDVEAEVNQLCATGLHIPINDDEVLSRINGIEGKYELIKLCAAYWGWTAQERNHLSEALGKGGFHGLKTWRDAVIHARVFDIKSSVARVAERRGKTAEVLLAPDALKGFYDRLVWMRVEIDTLDTIMARKRALHTASYPGRKEQLSQEIEASWIQAREHQTRRLSLPPMPEFPEDTLDLQRFAEALENHAGKGKRDRRPVRSQIES